MLSKFSSRKIMSVLIATTLILGASVALTASADAAGKQGTSCAKLKAKSGVYTCIANPLTTTPKLTWATANCVSAQTDYLANVANLTSYTKNSNDVTNQSKTVIASYQNALTSAQAALDAINVKVYTISASSNTTAVGINAAIAAFQAKLAADQASITTITAALAKDVVGSQQAKNDQATLNEYTKGAASRQKAIDTLTRTLARIQKQITNAQSNIVTWTSTLTAAINGQKQLTAQLNGAISTAKNARKLVCKVGL